MLDEKCLLVSPGRPQDWMIQAASVNFDLEEARAADRIRMFWVPSKIKSQAGMDEAAAYAMGELVDMILREQPDRLLIDDFTPFLQFVSFERFREAFVSMMARLEEVETTILLMMPDAVNMPSKQIIGFMRNHMSGSIHMALKEEATAENRRVVTLLPGLGHVNHEVFDDWEIPNLSLPEKRTSAHRQKTRASQNTPKRETAPQRVRAGTMDSLTDVSMPLMDVSASAVAIESMKSLELEHEAFYRKLRRSFKQRASQTSNPFLLIALRIDQFTIKEHGGSFEASALLEMIISAVENTMKRKNDLLVDRERHRLVAFLPDTQPEGVNGFFASIQEDLRQDYPDIADQLPHIVSAVVVPDGEPFENPEDFMAYAMEER
jgi:hypothetical protein